MYSGDALVDGLRAIGLEVRVAEAGRPERHVAGVSWGKRSQLLIEICREPIRWVNVVTQARGQKTQHTNIYVIPDSSISKEGWLRAARVKTIPIFGRVVDLRWKGKLAVSLIRRLDQDVLLSQTLMSLKEDIEVWSEPEFGCWSLVSLQHKFDVRTARLWQPVPNEKKWECYKTIARHLLGHRGT